MENKPRTVKKMAADAIAIKRADSNIARALNIMDKRLAAINLEREERKEKIENQTSDQVAQIIEKAQAYARKHRHEGGAK